MPYDAQSGQVHLDEALTKACVTGSLAAYDDYQNSYTHIKIPLPVPDGFAYRARFTGWDDIIGDHGAVERYGLIYQSTTNASEYMIAFRGTASLDDVYEDAWASDAVFEPFDATGFPADVIVADGFYSVYTTKDEAMPGSMRAQVFGYLAKVNPAPTRLIVTGHSLGAAIANLFALDAKVSLPGVDVVSTTIASPRTGKSAWQAAYNQTYGLEKTTFRIANHYDFVPSLPPKTIMGYEHVGQRFLVAFYEKGSWVPHVLARHALLNYQAVLNNALPASPQMWQGEFRDHVAGSHATMKSVYPNLGSEDAGWASRLKEMAEEFATDGAKPA